MTKPTATLWWGENGSVGLCTYPLIPRLIFRDSVMWFAYGRLWLYGMWKMRGSWMGLRWNAWRWWGISTWWPEHVLGGGVYWLRWNRYRSWLHGLRLLNIFDAGFTKSVRLPKIYQCLSKGIPLLKGISNGYPLPTKGIPYARFISPGSLFLIPVGFPMLL